MLSHFTVTLRIFLVQRCQDLFYFVWCFEGGGKEPWRQGGFGALCVFHCFSEAEMMRAKGLMPRVISSHCNSYKTNTRNTGRWSVWSRNSLFRSSWWKHQLCHQQRRYLATTVFTQPESYSTPQPSYFLPGWNVKGFICNSNVQEQFRICISNCEQSRWCWSCKWKAVSVSLVFLRAVTRRWAGELQCCSSSLFAES